MAWQYDPEYKCACDREAGLVIHPPIGGGRDNFRFKIKKLGTPLVILDFNARNVPGRFFDEEEKKRRPGFDHEMIFHVGEKDFSQSERELIVNALRAYALEGRARYEQLGPLGENSWAEVKFVSDHSQFFT